MSYEFLFVLIAVLFTNNQKKLSSSMYDQVGCVGLFIFLAKSEGLVFPLPYPEAGKSFW